MTKAILVAGDSWSCGEWDFGDQNYVVSHGGLAEYLSDAGHQIINLGKPGGSNTHAHNRVANFLQANKHLQISCAIVFQTEWLRDIFVEDLKCITEDVTYGYHNLKNRTISRFYYSLSRTGIKYNIPIYIVGGCADTIWLDQFEIEYPGLHISCQSLTNLLINGDHRNPDFVNGLYAHNTLSEVEYIKKKINSADLKLLLEDIEKGHQRLTTWTNNKNYFWPDGHHANRQAHYVLFKFLKTQIPNL
jgi:hypothetical protein